MLAYDYPLLGLFWTMFIIAVGVGWIILLFRVFADIFRSRSSGWSKGLWSIFVIVAPLLGVLIYLLVHGDSMGGRSHAESGWSLGSAGELGQLTELHSAGVLTSAEYESQKSKLLAD